MCGDACVAADTCPCEIGCDEQREDCVDNVCVCRSGLARCGAQCVDTRADPLHCGGCGGQCEGAEALCQDMDCVQACDPPLKACDGGCVDLSSDPLHCDACEVSCTAEQSCVLGDCQDASGVCMGGVGGSGDGMDCGETGAD